MSADPKYRMATDGTWQVSHWFDAEDCRNVAACMPSNDQWAAELLADANRLDELDGAADVG